MKKKVRFLIVLMAFQGFMHLASGQNVGITDKSDGITPVNLLQVHKDIATSGTLIQLSNQGTGEGVDDGIQLGIDGSQNGLIINKESGKAIILGGINAVNDNTTIENDGTIVFNGAATTWDDIRVSFAARNSGTAPAQSAFAGSGALLEWSFPHISDAGNEKYLYCEVQLPHGWNEGSTIYPHIHWAPATSGGIGNVTWQLDYAWADKDAVFPLSTPVTATVASIPTAAWTSTMTNFDGGALGAGISGSGKHISSILVCRITRIPDGYNGAVSLVGFDILYEINTIGSRTAAAK
ncbi:MAG: hypothetical protein NTW10_05835 [Bacteroidetes bacterium]|nr:hypothetical protein [Bacteroidota bacterium]